MLLAIWANNAQDPDTRREANHTAVVQQLAKKKIHSIYKQYQQSQGKEAHPTFYLQRKKEKPYHIDYCFASQSFCEKLTSIKVGEYEDWIGLSDHMPIILTFN